MVLPYSIQRMYGKKLQLEELMAFRVEISSIVCQQRNYYLK